MPAAAETAAATTMAAAAAATMPAATTAAAAAARMGESGDSQHQQCGEDCEFAFHGNLLGGLLGPMGASSFGYL
jgi:hypothetical protein